MNEFPNRPSANANMDYPMYSYGDNDDQIQKAI